jgi:chromate transporter
VAHAGLTTVLREWGRIGLVGFGGPPAHIALLRELVVERRRWLTAREFEDANAACQLLPGPASTQMAIYCARGVAGASGAVVGGLAFIVPGLLLTLAIAAVALAADPPAWVRGIGAGAAAAAVALVAGLSTLNDVGQRQSDAQPFRLSPTVMFDHNDEVAPIRHVRVRPIQRLPL